MDATGVGAGLSSFLDHSMPGKVIQFTFNQSTKSTLGWDFLSIIDSGRWHEYRDGDPFQTEFFLQLENCAYEILPGPAKLMRWSVPDGTRDSATGDLIHDDLVLSAALVAMLDQQDWTIQASPVIIRRPDPLKDMDHGF